LPRLNESTIPEQKERKPKKLSLARLIDKNVYKQRYRFNEDVKEEIKSQKSCLSQQKLQTLSSLGLKKENNEEQKS